ncbi:hypothetical protein EDC96DRAFT_516936 [Choanephora cucurbitarum]|nr:hypothetical protein EDC96DRAFT_516936 [Choanephora cucurbitarum]
MSLKNISDKDCWFVIGAHQAGASERQCAELSGLSRGAIHNILMNFRKLGSPHANQLSLDNLIDPHKRKQQSHTKDKSFPRKRGRPPKPKEAPFFTEAIVQETLAEARGSQIMNERVHKKPRIHPAERLDTPPASDEDSQSLSSPERNILPTTPRSNTDESEDELKQAEDWTVEDDKALLMHVLNLPSKHVKWKEAELLFNNRHLSIICADRWEFIKQHLLKDVQQAS